MVAIVSNCYSLDDEFLLILREIEYILEINKYPKSILIRVRAWQERL